MLNRFLVFLFVLGASAFAGLTWEETSIVRSAAPSDKETVAIFHFTNDGKKPVVLTKIGTSCDCVTAEISKKEYASGERGEIKVTFAVAGRVGLQRKTIEVLTDDAESAKETLTLSVNIQHPVQLSPAVLWWRLGDDKKTQRIHVTVTEDKPTIFTGVDCSNPDWKVDLKVVTAGRDYYVEATPGDTSKANAALVTLKTGSQNDQPLTARLRVQ